MKFEYPVPQHLVKIRPLAHQDAARLARWVECGRREGVFQRGTKLDASSVLCYQDGLRQSGWEYQCMVVENDRHSIGYFDYRYRNRTGEILGLYLDSQFRRGRVGRHLLRWVVAQLREHGCRKVQVEVYGDNVASLRTCRAAGFQRDAAQERVEDGKQVYGLCRSVEPFRRLSAPEPYYALLHGTNLYLHHVAVAEALVEQIQRIPGVEAILGLGSLARGFADEWSDVDLAVLGRGRGLRGLWLGERWLAGLSVDLFMVDLDRAPLSQWDDSRLQAFEESIVLFGRDASVIRSLQRAVRLGKRERLDRIRETLLKLGWLGFAPRTWYGQSKYGYIWSLPHDLWIRRGSVASAHTTVDRAADYALQLLFLTNGRRVPDPKWRRYLAPGLPWLPADFPALLESVEEGPRDSNGFRARAESTLAIIERTVQYLEAMGDIRDDLYKPYLRISPDYNPWI